MSDRGKPIIPPDFFTHVLPVNDLREHKESINCWCKPKLDNKDIRVVVHNSMDRREEYEQGRKKH